uniref:Type II secretion system protein GspF domain-containing protein n=1 Tax=Schlesneria paludicola TaxID=360056 RepID=A0A7C4QLH1_9PLAN
MSSDDEIADVNARRLGAADARGTLSLTLRLQALAEELRQRRVKRALAAVVRRLEQGATLDEAFRAEPTGLPPDLARLIAISLPGGQVELLIHDYLENARRLSDLRRSLILGLTYPLVLLLVFLAVMVFLMSTLLPMFKNLFEEFGTELPALTEFFLKVSDVLVNHGWAVAGVGLGLAAIVLGALRVFGGRAVVQNLWRSIPLLGQGLRWASLSNYCHLLATLMELHVPLPQALRAAATANDDKALAQAAERTADAMERGLPPDEAVQQTRSCLRELGPTLHGAGRGRDVVESLRATAEVFDARSRLQAQLVYWWCQPVLLIALAVTIGTLVVVFFLPLLKLLNDLS